MAKVKTKDQSTIEKIRARKRERKRNERKEAVKINHPQLPWPTEDKTPRNGLCNLSGGKFMGLPNNGKKMFDWVKVNPS